MDPFGRFAIFGLVPALFMLVNLRRNSVDPKRNRDSNGDPNPSHLLLLLFSVSII